jgi:hypothetical protein
MLERRGFKRWGVRPLLVVFVLSLLLLLHQGTVSGIDGESNFQVTRALVDHGRLSVPPGTPHVDRGRGGRYYSKFGVGLPLLSTGPYLLAKPFEGLATTDLERVAVSTIMPVITALLSLVLYELGLALGARPRDALLVALAAVFGTYLLVYSKEFFGEPLMALGVALALWRSIAGHPTQAALALVLAMQTRPQAAFLAPFFWLYWVRDMGLRRSLVPGVVLAAGAGSLLFYNWLRFDDVTRTGYPADQGFRLEFWSGAWGLLAHGNKSLFLFVPLAIVLPLGLWALKRRGRTELAALMAAIVLVGFLAAASWSVWYGGWTWGPRLLLPALIPILPVLAVWICGSARNRRVVLALALAGALVSLPAVIVPTTAQQNETSEQRGPTVTRQYELIGPSIRNTWERLPPAGASLGTHPRYLYLWQVSVRRELGPGGAIVAALLSLLLLAAAVVSGSLLWRAIRRAGPPLDIELPGVDEKTERERAEPGVVAPEA